MKIKPNKKPLKSKKTIKKATKKTKVNLPKLPSVWSLVKKTWFECSTFWRPLLGIVIIYVILYFILVLGLNLSTAWQDQILLSDSTLGDAFSTIFGAFSSGGLSSASSSDATTIMQYLLFILASMAFVWTLRKLQGLKQIKWRDAYYQGTSALVPTVVICLVLALTFIPAILGSSILATALQLSTIGAEVAIVSAIAAALLFISLLLFVMFWPAFYIVSLPQTRPVQALRSASKVTKNRRLAIMRKAIVWMIICLVTAFILLMPIAMLVPAAVGYFVFIGLFLFFGVSHIYFYNLYRSLL
jgi:hypothetical protein